MPGSMIRGFDDAEYRRLLQAFPPRPIRDDRQLEATEEQIGQLLAVPERTPAQDEYLDLLSDLVRDWEAEQVDIPPVAGIEVVKFLCEQHALPQRALVPIFGTPSVVSDVLAGRRALQAKHIEGLARFFHVSPAAFFPVTTRPGAERTASEPVPAS
jgi:HTH-type transcriptional regulator / antitoxin HigA